MAFDYHIVLMCKPLTILYEINGLPNTKFDTSNCEIATPSLQPRFCYAAIPRYPQMTELRLVPNIGILHLDRAAVEATDLLRIDVALLGTAGRVIHLGLPGGYTLHEHLLDIFQRLSGCLGEHEEGVDRHGGAEDAEDEVDLPLDGDESWRNEVG
jgi:hypothetical protein